MCLSKVSFSGKGSNDEQEARIRYSCGLLTGMTLLGGTYAYEGDVVNNYGHVVGSDAERARAVKFASNKDLTLLGRQGRSFRPVEGSFIYRNTLFSKDDISCDNEFVLDTQDAFYYAVFNYGTDGSGVLDKDVDFGRLGIKVGDYDNVTELWTGATSSPSSLRVNVPVKDVRIYRFEKPGFGGSGVTEATGDDGGAGVTVKKGGNNIEVKALSAIDTVDVYSIDGTHLNSTTAEGTSGSLCIPLDSAFKMCIVKVVLSNGKVRIFKVI